MNPIAGRANTTTQKSSMMQSLFQAWIKCPELRFGQLIINAMQAQEKQVPLFYIEDCELEKAVVEFIANVL
jgi:hypothetical protein